MKKILGVVILSLCVPMLSFGLSFLSLQGGYQTTSPNQSGFARMSFESIQQTIVGDTRVLMNADLPFGTLSPTGSYSMIAHFDFLSWLQIHPLLRPVLMLQAVTEDASQSPSMNIGGGVLFYGDDGSTLKYFSLDAAFLYNQPQTNGFAADLFSSVDFNLVKVLLFKWRLGSRLSMYNANLEWTTHTEVLYDLDSIQKANPMNLDLSDEATLIGLGGDFTMSVQNSTTVYGGGGRLILAWQF